MTALRNSGYRHLEVERIAGSLGAEISGADLSEDHLGGPSRPARDRHQQRHRRFVRGQELIDPDRERVDGGVGLIDPGQHRPGRTHRPL